MSFFTKTALALSSLLFVYIVSAHPGATGVVKQRMDAMGEMGDKSKAVASMLKGKSDYDPLVIKTAAEAFVKHAELIPELFPDTEKSRTGSKTEALPRIWDDWAKFIEYSETFAANSIDLMTQVDSGAEQLVLKKSFFKVAKSCRGCHKRYRKPKK